MKVTLLDHRVEKELNKLDSAFRASFRHVVELMAKHGTHALGMPLVRKLKGYDLWEIRLKAKAGIARALYVTVEKDEIVILHAFQKKAQETPPQAVKVAMRRMRELGGKEYD